MVTTINYQIQPIDFIVKNNIPMSREANVIKYIVRHQNKNGKKDIEKAMHYCTNDTGGL